MKVNERNACRPSQRNFKYTNNKYKFKTKRNSQRAYALNYPLRKSSFTY